jgi:uncharacterized protein (TIGR03437 family)
LAANTYYGTIQVQVGSQSGTLNVSLVVGGGGATGNTAAAPTSLNFAYQLGTNNAFIARQKLVITGPPGAWSSTISSGASWLHLDPSSGSSLPNPSIDSATPTVSIDPTGLQTGSSVATITVTTQGGSQTINVTINVYSGVVLLPTPGALVFSAQTGQSKPSPQAVYFSGSDNSLNPLSITATASSPWMSITSGAAYVAVQVDQTGLTTGVYSGYVTVSQAGAANSPTTIPILLVVNGGGGGGTYGNLTFSQNPITFTSTSSVTTPSSTTLTVSASASTSFVASISYASGSGSWLTLNPLTGVTPANLSVSANSAGLSVGTYTATIAFSANGVIQSVNVTLTVSAGGGGTGNVVVSPTGFTFMAPLGSNPASQTLSVTSASGAAGISFTTQVTSGPSWLTTNANSSNTTPATFTVSVSSSSMAAGTYYGNILVTPSGGTAVNIPVTLTVAAPTSVSATPTTVTFNYRMGDSAPAAQTLTVSGGGATLAFSATPSSTGNWLVASPALGTTPGTVSVSINTANLPAGVGTYSGTVLVAGAGGASGATTVTVTVNVTAPLPTVSKVANAASYASGSIAPGEIITLFGSDPTRPIGPATPAGLALDASGKVATTIGGVQVLIQGYACPMIYASATQVSAVVPYEIKYLTGATVLVKFLGQSSNTILMNVATTVPGVFTLNASGTGPGAILNSNSIVNSAANPATRGDVVVIYMTGEGETSPAGVTGKVTTVASPPLPLTPGPLLQPSVTIGGQPASWFFAGEAPGFVSGVMQLNVVVPTNIAAGDQPVVVIIGGTPSQQGVTVSVK